MDVGEITSVIESLEEKIISGIRASGIKRERELSLVDLLLNLRKERRRALKFQNDEILSMKNVIDSKILDLSGSENNFVSSNSFESNVQLLENLIVRRKDSELKTALEEKTLECEMMSKEKIASLKKKYEELLVQLESRIEELQGAQKKVLEDQFSERLNELKSNLQKEMSQYSENRLRKYQSTLSEMSSREKDLEKEIEKLTDTINQHVKDKRAYVQTIMTMDANYKEKLIEIKNLNENLEMITVKFNDVNKLKHRLQEEMIQLRQNHEAQLEKIDLKVRKLLEQKDNKISVLGEELQECQLQCQKFQESFLELQNHL